MRVSGANGIYMGIRWRQCEFNYDKVFEMTKISHWKMRHRKKGFLIPFLLAQSDPSCLATLLSIFNSLRFTFVCVVQSWQNFISQSQLFVTESMNMKHAKCCVVYFFRLSILPNQINQHVFAQMKKLPQEMFHVESVRVPCEFDWMSFTVYIYCENNKRISIKWAKIEWTNKTRTHITYKEKEQHTNEWSKQKNNEQMRRNQATVTSH